MAKWPLFVSEEMRIYLCHGKISLLVSMKRALLCHSKRAFTFIRGKQPLHFGTMASMERGIYLCHSKGSSLMSTKMGHYWHKWIYLCQRKGPYTFVKGKGVLLSTMANRSILTSKLALPYWSNVASKILDYVPNETIWILHNRLVLLLFDYVIVAPPPTHSNDFWNSKFIY